MATETQTELSTFQEFVARLARDPHTKDWTAEDALALWRQREADVQDPEHLAALRSALADMEAGRGTPLEEWVQEFRQRHNIPEDEPRTAAAETR